MIGAEEIVLVIMGGVFVVETLSVLLQVASFTGREPYFVGALCIITTN